MKNYYRLMLGRKSVHEEECHAGNFVGVDFAIQQDLVGHLPDEWRAFNKKFIPLYLETDPNKTKIGAGLACGAIWTVCKGMHLGDILLCPDGTGQYRIAEIAGDYQYTPGKTLPHRRAVKWFDKTIRRDDMSEALRNSSGSIGVVSNITKYAEEIEGLIGDTAPPKIIAIDKDIEDPSTFALEKHLEEFLVQNWAQTELGHGYDIYKEDGDLVGQQYPTDTGPVDILAISKDSKTLLVVELKRGKASDVVVGQLLRYMGFVKDELAENGQAVRGVVIALEDDQRLKRALSVVSEIDFYRYTVSFKLEKA